MSQLLCLGPTRTGHCRPFVRRLIFLLDGLGRPSRLRVLAARFSSPLTR